MPWACAFYSIPHVHARTHTHTLATAHLLMPACILARSLTHSLTTYPPTTALFRSKSTFWCQHRFYGVNMSGLHDAAVDEYFGTPVVDAMDPRLLLCQPMRIDIDFHTATEEDLACIRMPVHFTHENPATVHGLVFWFDVVFAGSSSEVCEKKRAWGGGRCWYFAMFFFAVEGAQFRRCLPLSLTFLLLRFLVPVVSARSMEEFLSPKPGGIACPLLCSFSPLRSRSRCFSFGVVLTGSASDVCVYTIVFSGLVDASPVVLSVPVSASC